MSWLDDLTLDTVVVHTTEELSVKGIRVSVYDDGIVLRDARVLEDEGMSRILDGEVFIPRDRVHFVQIVKAD